MDPHRYNRHSMFLRKDNHGNSDSKPVRESIMLCCRLSFLANSSWCRRGLLSFTQSRLQPSCEKPIFQFSLWSHLILRSFRSSPRPISISKLLRYRIYTADLSPGSLPGVLLLSNGILILEVGFTLRCLQRLSRPHFASQLCPWQDNCCTSDAFTPVLSY